jgi:hypothetical protein
MTQKEKIINEFIQFTAEAGGKVDFEQARYWGLTFLEHEDENNNDILLDVKETFDEAKMKRIVPHYIVGLGNKLLCNELRFIITDFLNRNEPYKKEVERLNSL